MKAVSHGNVFTDVDPQCKSQDVVNSTTFSFTNGYNQGQRDLLN